MSAWVAVKPDALTLQANAIRDVAVTSTARDITLTRAMDGAETIEAVQRSKARKAAAGAASAVQVLPVTATAAELRHARMRRAVSKGKDVYLPSWRETVVGLPNAFLRSALFSVSGPLTEAVFEHPIAVQGDIAITLTGHKLIDYDRQVFATVLNYYRDRPLSDADAPEWIHVSYWQFAEAMGKANGKDVYKAIHDSLVRLNAAHLRLRVNHRDIPLPTLVSVIFNYTTPTPAGTTTRLKADIEFRVSAAMAELYGPADWSSVPCDALDEYRALPRWLNSFYATHSVPYAMSIKRLHQLSDSSGDLRAFRRALRVALEKLQTAETPSNIRVRSFKLDSANDELTVHLTRWAEPLLLLK